MNGISINTYPQYNQPMQQAYNPYGQPQYNPYGQQQQPSYGYGQNQYNPYGQNQYNPYGQQYNPYGQQYNPYSQNQYNQPQYNPYGQNQYNQPQYNPYGQNQYNPYTQNTYQPRFAMTRYTNPQYGYGNTYGYNSYSPMQSYQAYEKQRNDALQIAKIKMRMIGKSQGITYTEEQLDRMCNPYNPANMLTEEQIMENNEYERMKRYSDLFKNPNTPPTKAAMRAQVVRETSTNFHKAFDNISMCEFFEDVLWQMNRDNFFRENVDRNFNRDLSRTYFGKDFNQLLNMHKTENSYINDLIDNSKYDNNIDDMEIGMEAAFDMERRKRRLLESPVPQLISSPEVQEHRNRWLNKIAEQMYKKQENKFQQGR